MKRVVVLGRGGAGKSTLSRDLARRLQLPVHELDKMFWDSDLNPMATEEWRRLQEGITKDAMWVMDGYLGRYDDLEPRLRRADTVVVLDFPLWLCVWRSLRRGPERIDYWRWVLGWPRDRKKTFDAIQLFAERAQTVVLKSPQQVDHWLEIV